MIPGPIALEYRAGDTMKAIALRYGCTQQTIRNRLVGLGVEIRKSDAARSRPLTSFQAGVRAGHARRKAERRDFWEQLDPNDYFGAALPFVRITDRELQLLEGFLMRQRQISFIMTHDGDGLPTGVARPNYVDSPIMLVNAGRTKVSETWKGVEEDEDGHPAFFSNRPCRVSYDGGATWHSFTPKRVDSSKRPRVRRSWRQEVAFDLRQAGLLPRGAGNPGAHLRKSRRW